MSTAGPQGVRREAEGGWLWALAAQGAGSGGGGGGGDVLPENVHLLTLQDVGGGEVLLRLAHLYQAGPPIHMHHCPSGLALRCSRNRPPCAAPLPAWLY